MDQEFMKEKPVMPLVISMALPMTFSMLVNALYNIIDSYFVAQISEDAMTALSLVFRWLIILGHGNSSWQIKQHRLACY